MLCFVPNCSHYSEKHTCKFYRFPQEEKERSRWIKAIRRKDREPSNNCRVCSCHFKDQNKQHCPLTFPWNQDKIFQFPSPVKKKSRKMLESEQDSTETAMTTNLEIESNPDPNCKSTQTICSVQLEAEIVFKDEEIKKLKNENENLKKQPFGFHSIEDNDGLIKYYTGVEVAAFKIIVKLCSSAEFIYFYGWKPANLSLEDQILITLMKLRLNLGYVDLSVRFSTSKHTIGNVVLTFIHLLHEILFEAGMKEVPSQAKNLLSLPNCFINFKNCRMIIDCTEFQCAVPKPLDEQRETYSSYKHYNTLKGLVGIAPNGVITFCSLLYPGSTSDKMIVKHSNIIAHFKPGDLILADKGFLLQDIVPPYVSVNIPPFLTAPQFTPSEVEKTKNIARARIHVERAIRRLKAYHIMRFIPKSLYKYSSKVFQLCAALTNYESPLIREVADSYKLTDDTEK